MPKEQLGCDQNHETKMNDIITIQYNTTQYNPIQSNTIQSNTTQYNQIKSNTTQYHTIQYGIIGVQVDFKGNPAPGPGCPIGSGAPWHTPHTLQQEVTPRGMGHSPPSAKRPLHSMYHVTNMAQSKKLCISPIV